MTPLDTGLSILTALNREKKQTSNQNPSPRARAPSMDGGALSPEAGKPKTVRAAAHSTI